MFIDFTDANCAIPAETDLCIVGAGVMGLAITSHLLNHSRRRILLVEEGELEDRETSAAVAAETNSGDLPSAVAGSRARGFGGSSRRWGGQALPFSPLDLADRPFLPELGAWPISWDELNRFYPAVDRFLGLGPLPFNADLWRRPQVTAPFGADQDLELTISKYSPHAYLASVHQPTIADSSQVVCLLNAKVASLELEQEGQLRGLRIRSRGGRELTIQARQVVLCAGGIENARILLSSPQGEGGTAGNRADLVGRYYQDHVGFFAAQLQPLDWKAFRHLFASFIPGKQKYVPKLQLSQALQRRDGLLNVTGNLDVQEDGNSPRNSARRIYNSLRRNQQPDGGRRSTFQDGWRLVRATPQALDLLTAHLLERRIALPRCGRFYLMANAESEPLHGSRITLGPERDAFGLRRPQVHWLVSDLTRAALCTYAQALKGSLESAGIATVKISPYLLDPAANWKERAYSLYHHMGATRMAASANAGVVDSYGRVHGVENLYIAGTSILPTGSASNPSYTALALALRTAEQLLRQI
jgi:choline dehydrogenase-like flavoprotein